jgi:hypothetical protein
MEKKFRLTTTTTGYRLYLPFNSAIFEALMHWLDSMDALAASYTTRVSRSRQ